MYKCPNCGSNIKPMEKFCGKCGTALQVFQNNMNENNQIIQNDNISGNELVDAFIGQNADKLKNGSFSANTFFFGFFYVLYRKMWLLGAVWFAISIITNLFLSSFSLVIMMVLDIVASIEFKKIYVKHANEEVEKIKQENPNATKEQLLTICRNKGGTTVLPVILLSVFYTFVIILSFLAAFSLIGSTKDAQKNADNLDKASSSEVIGDLKFSVPSLLVKSKYQSNSYKSYKTSVDSDTYCNFNIMTSNAEYYENDAKRYLEKNIFYSASDTYSGISQKNINNINWFYADVMTSYNAKFYYSTIYNKTIYEFEFSITNDKNELCSKAYDEILNSMRFN